MNSLIRANVSVVWFALCALTILSWALGTTHGVGVDDHIAASVAVLAVAIFKIRLVGLYFMELKDAPLFMRGVFEVYCAALFCILVVLFLFA